MTTRNAWAWGLATVHTTGSVLDAWFPEPKLGTDLTDEPSSLLAEAQHVDEIRQVETKVVRVEIDLDEAPASVEDAYLRLHLLSARLVEPHGVNLTGVFGILPNNAWTTAGPVRIGDVARVRVCCGPAASS